jgi:ATP-dependent Clp protease adaptor protein ClpS
MSQTVLEPRSTDDSILGNRWMVVIHDNPINSMDEVVDILMEATQCDIEEASIEMWEAHTFGKAPVYFNPDRSECLRVAAVISSIGIKTEVSPEWND